MSELAQIGDVAVSHLADRRPLLWAGATTFDILLDGSQTGGSLGLLDQFGRRGDATPLHVHRSEAEVFYLIEAPTRRGPAMTLWCSMRERPSTCHPTYPTPSASTLTRLGSSR